MIEFWDFALQNLDKPCYTNFLMGTLCELWVAQVWTPAWLTAIFANIKQISEPQDKMEDKNFYKLQTIIYSYIFNKNIVIGEVPSKLYSPYLLV